MDILDLIISLNGSEIFWIVVAAWFGVAWGILGGAIPGISPSITMALILPLTYTFDPGVAIVLLAATYIGAEYGGSIPAILINTPGTNAAAATVIDGYPMNKSGQGPKALGISLYSGLIGGIIGLSVLILFTKPLSQFALQFTPMSYFGIGVLGLSVIVSLSNGSLLKGLASGCIGLMLASIGTDPVTGVSRFTFGSPDLLEGIKPIIVMVGLFAITEVINQSTDPLKIFTISSSKIHFPSFKEKLFLLKSQLIGSFIGTIEGIIPGAGGTIASFLSYNEAKRWSSKPDLFGQGSAEGIAAPECANNTVACTALIPVLSFGIPGSNSAAILLGGLLIHGITPGPTIFTDNPDTINTLYFGLIIAIVGLYFIGRLILPVCLWIVNKPRFILISFIYLTVFPGIFSIDSSHTDVLLVLIFGTFGLALNYFKFPFLPLILGLVLGYLIESNMRRSLVLSDGSYTIFFTDKLCLLFIIVAVLFVTTALYRKLT
jgi:putative tricarboxylic transport membrane protein